MPRVSDIIEALEEIAPSRFAFEFDKVGHQVGDAHQTVSRAVVSMDPSMAAVEFGRSAGAQLLLSHHPLLFNPASTVTASSHQGRTILELVKADMSFIAAHTNWDSAKGGINDTLAKVLGLTVTDEFGSGAEVAQLKLVVFAPLPDVDKIVDAAAAAGAGTIGAYGRCAFIGAGSGTFQAGASTNPTVGAPGERTTVEEARIEMVLPAPKRRSVERAVRKAHSYEEPAIDFVSLAPAVEQRCGRLCALPEPTVLGELAARVSSRLGLSPWTWGAPDRVIKKVALVGGAADSEWIAAQRAGADVLITGEVKQHIGLEASESGFALIAAGHYATENPGTMALLDRVAAYCPEVEWIRFEPHPGSSGRPF